MATRKPANDKAAALRKVWSEEQDETPGSIQHAQPGRYYSSFYPDELRPNMVRRLRDKLRTRGYQPIAEDDPEYIAGRSDAEIWWCDEETAKAHFEIRKDINSRYARQSEIAREEQETRKHAKALQRLLGDDGDESILQRLRSLAGGR